LLDSNSCTSPSGFPPLQVIKAAGIVSAIVCPVINENTLLSPTVGPRFSQTGNEIVARAKHLNPIVDKVNTLSPATATMVVNTISESTSESGVTVDGVLLKDGGIQLASGVIQKEVVVVIGATQIVGTDAEDLGHANGATLVAAPTSDYTLEFVSAIAIYDFDTAAYTGGASDLVVAIGSAGAAISGVATMANLLGAAGDKIVYFVPLATVAVPMSVGTAISLRGTAITNPGTAAGVLRVYTTYRIITTGL